MATPFWFDILLREPNNLYRSQPGSPPDRLQTLYHQSRRDVNKHRSMNGYLMFLCNMYVIIKGVFIKYTFFPRPRSVVVVVPILGFYV